MIFAIYAIVIFEICVISIDFLQWLHLTSMSILYSNYKICWFGYKPVLLKERFKFVQICDSGETTIYNTSMI